MFIKKLLPSSLVAQVMAAVLLALLFAQAISLTILGGAYKTALFTINQKSQLQQVESLVWLLESSALDEYGAILAASRSRTAWFTVERSSLVSTGQDQRLAQQLLERLGSAYQGRIRVVVNSKAEPDGHMPPLNSDEDAGESCEARQGCEHPWHKRDDSNGGLAGKSRGGMMAWRGQSPAGEMMDGLAVKLTSLKLSVQLQNGLWLNLRAASPLPPPLAAGQTLLFLALSILFVLLALGVMLGRITRPLRMLTRASNRLGVGERVPSLPESGPVDLRKTIRAFNRMNDRLQRFVSDRTRMLAALSHDLRTPITSMRLRVELMSAGQDRERLLATLDEMQQMSEATLAFMRQVSDNEPTRQVEFNALLGSLCDDLAELGAPVCFQEGEETVMACRPVSMKRALRNLIENAVNYGGQAQIRFYRRADLALVIAIEDAGPGIPEELLKKVFEPFFRLEASRNRGTGGTGLGLAIARNIIRSHGGDIELTNRAQGLLVEVVLPDCIS